jgi:hypothetical protein
MTPAKCARHEYRPGEFADGPRYTRALLESRTCWRCHVKAFFARIVYRFQS